VRKWLNLATTIDAHLQRAEPDTELHQLPATMHNSDSRTSLLDKPRGANRSTKIAGKLKLLPEQPERLPVLSKSLYKTTGPNDDAVGSTGESEDGDVESSEDNEQNEADFEVSVRYGNPWTNY